jgi:predicted Zn-dependent peptidase
LKRKDFIDYRNAMYNTSNTMMVVVTSLPKRKIFKMCDRYFADHTFGSNDPHPINPEIFKTSKNRRIKRDGIQQCFLLGAFPSVSLHDKNAKHQCMFNALGGGMHSLLFAEVREKHGLCYSVSAFDYMSNENSGVSAVYTQVDSENENKAKDKIIEVIEGVRLNGFDRNTFECAKYDMLGSYCRQIEGVRKLGSNIGKSYLMNEKIDFKKKYKDLESLKFEDVNAYAMDYWSDKNISWVSMK